MKDGDKITIWDGPRFGQDKPIGTAHVVAVGPRLIKTNDGRRWSAKTRREVDARGSAFGKCKIEPYKTGDESRVDREARLARARSFLSGYDWEIRRDFELLSDEDLDTLGALAVRLADARKTRDVKKNEASR